MKEIKITEIENIRIGSAENKEAGTGCTVIICERGAAAGLDVYEEETAFFFEDFSENIHRDQVLSLLLSMPNVLLTSHQAFLTNEALKNIAEVTLQNLADFFDGKPLQNEVKTGQL